MGEMVASRCEQVLGYLADKDKAAYGVFKDEVKELLSTLSRIEKSFKSSGVDPTEIRKLGYKIEDDLETWAVEVEAACMAGKDKMRRAIDIMSRLLMIRRPCVIRQGDGMSIKNIVKEYGPRMRDLREQVRDTKFLEQHESTESDDHRCLVEKPSGRFLRHVYDMEEHFVRHKDLKELIDLVQKQKHHVVWIWGAEGLGKTTLARKLYLQIQTKTKSRFKAYAWVGVTQDHQIGSLLHNMLNQLREWEVVEHKKNGAEGSPFSKVRQKIGSVKESAHEKIKDSRVIKFIQRRWSLRKSPEEEKNGGQEKKQGAEDYGFSKALKSVVAVKESAQKKIKESIVSKFIQRRWQLRKSLEEEKNRDKEKKQGAEDSGFRRAQPDKESAEEQQESSEGIDDVMNKLKEIQRQNNCFIVIDGISESQWRAISGAFQIQVSGTLILLTTNDDATKITGHDAFPYKLSLLDEEEDWELLQKHVFQGKKAPELGLVPKLGREMVRKCEGLPLAISRLGRTLRKTPFSEWDKVNDDVERYSQQDDHQIQSIEKVAFPDYDKLPYHLKQCFLYLAIFKENEYVNIEDLKFLWMAEGMISPQQMDTAEGKLIHVLSSTNPLRIRLHNVVRESCLHHGENEDFRLKVFDFSGGEQPISDPFSLINRTRRLVIHLDKLSSQTDQQHDVTIASTLRSLFFLNYDRDYVDLPVRRLDFSEFILLRVLHFVRCKFEGRKLPEGIWKLLNLRYFGVLYCDLDKLPPSITNFRNLQVLNVRSYDDSKIVIPSVIYQMKSLKHVRLPSNLEHGKSDKKLKLDGLLDLETLDGVNAGIHDIHSLSKLKKLRHVVIHAYSNGSLESIIKFVKSHGARIRIKLVIEHSCDLTSLEAMPVLEEVLMCPNLNALTFSMAVMHKFPNCGKYASEDLTEMKLIGCKLSEDPMEALGKFPNLRKLWLGYGAFVGTKMAIRNGGFLNLEYLEFRCLLNLEEWNVDKVAMKNLSTLIVRKCPVLKGIPYELASHTTLKNMEIELPPTALPEAQYKIYKEMFGFVTSRSIREFDPLSAATSSDH